MHMLYEYKCEVASVHFVQSNDAGQKSVTFPDGSHDCEMCGNENFAVQNSFQSVSMIYLAINSFEFPY